MQPMGERIGMEGRLDALGFAFDSSPDLVFATDAEGVVLYLNGTARIRGKELSHPVSAAALLPAEYAERFNVLARVVLSTGEGTRFEWGDEGAAGVRSWFGCTLSALRIDGVIVGCLCVATDRTDVKRAEERLRHSEQLMVDTQGVAHLGTWDWDITQPNATWSAELYRIYGLSPDNYAPSYERYLTMVHPDDRQRVMDATNRVFHEHVPYSHDERIFRPDGTVRYLHTWAHPVLDDGGRLVRLVGVCQDITDRKRAEEEVRQLNFDLERRVAERTRTIENSMRDLEAFNVMASHDLRAPLSVIQNSCTLILRQAGEPLSAKVIENLARIQRSVAHMSSLVNDLLKLAQVAHAPLAFVDVDITAMCNEALSILRRASPDRHVTIQVEEGLRAFCDPGLMRAALDNLLANAWKYSSRVEHARIEVGAAPAAGGRRTFFVRDNGAGFDMKDAPRLFAPFQRLHKASDFEGTGVGLTAVHRIIERHGGRIWAEGAPGRGATFSFEVAVGTATAS